MPTPNLFLLYVKDPQASATFYTDLLGQEPVASFPGYVAFDIGHGMLLSLWAHHRIGAPFAETGFRSEIAFLVSGDGAVDAMHRDWTGRGIPIEQDPHDDVFGRTFVALDPDGHRIRVCPRDA
ncbi:VOC family protein [Pseudarthrobacter sp. P1]|uniref:VOC family protein n=1 Tax=Pseudarthrobacter sp. P1 TaxID=3418418 RepID=UPI003CF3B20B